MSAGGGYSLEVGCVMLPYLTPQKVRTQRCQQNSEKILAREVGEGDHPCVSAELCALGRCRSCSATCLKVSPGLQRQMHRVFRAAGLRRQNLSPPSRRSLSGHRQILQPSDALRRAPGRHSTSRTGSAVNAAGAAPALQLASSESHTPHKIQPARLVSPSGTPRTSPSACTPAPRVFFFRCPGRCC